MALKKVYSAGVWMAVKRARLILNKEWSKNGAYFVRVNSS